LLDIWARTQSITKDIKLIFVYPRGFVSWW